MSWKRISDFAGSIGPRLSLGYTLIFTLSAALLFVLLYYLLGAAINAKDEDVVRSRLHEYEAIYNGGGIDALKAWLDRTGGAAPEQTFFVRVLRPGQAVLLVILPVDWLRTDLTRLSEQPPAGESFLRLPRDANVDLTVASAQLPDGTSLQVGRSSDSREQLLRKFRSVFALVIAPVLVLGFIGGTWMTNRTMRPLRQTVETVQSIIRTGRLDVRVPTPRTHGELEDLVQLLNRMLAGNENLIHALRGSLDNVAHDLRTPLSRLRIMLEEVLRHESDLVTARQAVAGALEETDRVETLIRTLMDVTLAETGMMKLELAPTDLNALIDDVTELYEDVAADKAILLEKKLGEGMIARVDAARMRQVFANLLDNALKYTPRGGHVTITTRRDGGQVAVALRDDGEGVALKDLPHIWDRLYRGDKSRTEHGLGLGLSLVKAIVTAHGGTIEVTSVAHEGSEFCVLLPGGI